MIVKYKGSNETIDLSEPKYVRHYMLMYGYLVCSNGKILFFYNDGFDDATYEDLTDEFELEQAIEENSYCKAKQERIEAEKELEKTQKKT